MALKTIRLKLTKLALTYVFILVFFSCNTSIKDKITNLNSNSLDVNKLTSYNPVDSIAHLLNLSIAKDTFEYQGFYNDSTPYELLYFKAGNVLTSKTKHSIALYTTNDTTALCKLYYLEDSKWIKSDGEISLYISGFSPAYFHVHFDDYNFDGNRDLYVIFYNSMGVADSYGYILTFNESMNSLTSHPETIIIPNLDIDRKSKKLISSSYYKLGGYRITTSFSWINDTLRPFSEN